MRWHTLTSGHVNEKKLEKKLQKMGTKLYRFCKKNNLTHTDIWVILGEDCNSINIHAKEGDVLKADCYSLLEKYE